MNNCIYIWYLKATKVGDEKAQIFFHKKMWPKFQKSFPLSFVLRFLWPSKNISNQILLHFFALDTFLFLARKISSLYDIASQSYIKNKINANLLHHPLELNFTNNAVVFRHWNVTKMRFIARSIDSYCCNIAL
jgi:hypothetical protein